MIATLITEFDDNEKNALEKTVGEVRALSPIVQKQFFEYQQTKEDKYGAKIRPTIYNGKLGWVMTFPDSQKRLYSKADPDDLAKIPSKLLNAMEDISILEQKIPPESMARFSKIQEKLGLQGMIPELISFVLNLLTLVLQLGKSGPEGMEYIQKRVSAAVESDLKIGAGVGVRELFTAAFKKGWLANKTAKSVLNRFLKILHSKIPHCKDDPFVAAGDFNAHMITPAVARMIRAEWPEGTGHTMLSTLKTVWNRAAQNPDLMVNGVQIFPINPWNNIDLVKALRSPICALWIDQVFAVLRDVLLHNPMHYLPVLIEYTLGLRGSEASGGETRAHTNDDQFQLVCPRDFTFKGGHFGCGFVTVRCHKTNRKGIEFRAVDLTPLAFSFWKPIIDSLRAAGLNDVPIYEKPRCFVSRALRDAYERTGVRPFLARQAGLPVEEIGKTWKPYKSLGRHSYLTALTWHCIHELKLGKDYVRTQAGHTSNSITLEQRYLVLSNQDEGTKYITGTAPGDLSYDPIQARKDYALRVKQSIRKNAATASAAHSKKVKEMRALGLKPPLKPYVRRPLTPEGLAAKKAKCRASKLKYWATKTEEERKAHMRPANTSPLKGRWPGKKKA